mgnify:CR=1 FL=1
MKSIKFKLLTVSFFAILSFGSSSIAQQHEKRELHCVCVTGTSACPLKFFDELADKPRHEWNQDIFIASGRTLTQQELNQACWRKRDVDDRGGGLCCSLDNNEKDADRFFKGSL